MIVWSYGGGTQSIAIAVLIKQGRLPMPEMIVMADTGREATETWEYTDRYIRPMGFDIRVIPHSYATVDLYAASKNDLLIPAYTQTGKLPTFCSVKWKQRPIRRYLREQGVIDCVMWMGMSLDEIDRMRVSDVKWITNHYPLVFDVRLRRHECAKLVEDYGLPTPPKSSCWMCPHRRNNQWRRLRDEYPDDWNKAIELDEQITQSHNVYLHETGQPLATVDLGQDAPELPLFLICESGYCMV